MFNKLIILIAAVRFVFALSQSGDNSKDFDTVLKFAEYTTWNRQTGENFVILIAQSNDADYEKAVKYLENQEI